MVQMLFLSRYGTNVETENGIRRGVTRMSPRSDQMKKKMAKIIVVSGVVLGAKNLKRGPGVQPSVSALGSRDSCRAQCRTRLGRGFEDPPLPRTPARGPPPRGHPPRTPPEDTPEDTPPRTPPEDTPDDTPRGLPIPVLISSGTERGDGT